MASDDRLDPYVAIRTTVEPSIEEIQLEIEEITLDLINNAKFALSRRRNYGRVIANEVEVVDQEPDSYKSLQITIFREWLREMFATGKAKLVQVGSELYMTLDTPFDTIGGLQLSTIQISNLRPVK